MKGPPHLPKRQRFKSNRQSQVLTAVAMCVYSLHCIRIPEYAGADNMSRPVAPNRHGLVDAGQTASNPLALRAGKNWVRVVRQTTSRLRMINDNSILSCRLPSVSCSDPVRMYQGLRPSRKKPLLVSRHRDDAPTAVTVGGLSGQCHWRP